MTEEEAKMVPIRRLWAAVLGQAITDYRYAVMHYEDDAEQRIRRELETMGYGRFVDMLQYSARRFRYRITEAVKKHNIPQGRYARMDCPCCETEGAVYLYNRKVSYCALCTACGLRYKIPKEL